MTLNIETSNEAIGNKLPFSVLLCMRVYILKDLGQSPIQSAQILAACG